MSISEDDIKQLMSSLHLAVPSIVVGDEWMLSAWDIDQIKEALDAQGFAKLMVPTALADIMETTMLARLVDTNPNMDINPGSAIRGVVGAAASAMSGALQAQQHLLASFPSSRPVDPPQDVDSADLVAALWLDSTRTALIFKMLERTLGPYEDGDEGEGSYSMRPKANGEIGGVVTQDGDRWLWSAKPQAEDSSILGGVEDTREEAKDALDAALLEQGWTLM